MVLEKEIAVTDFLIRRIKKGEKKECLQKSWLREFQQEKKEEGAVVLFLYFSWCLIFFDIGFVSFTHASLLKFPLSYFLILFYQSFFRKLFSRAIKAFFMTQKYF